MIIAVTISVITEDNKNASVVLNISKTRILRQTINIQKIDFLYKNTPPCFLILYKYVS